MNGPLWQRLKGHHPNTYTFTKALAEQLLTQRHLAPRIQQTSASWHHLARPPFQLVVVRPSIIR